MTYSGSKAVAVAGTAERLKTGYNPCFTLTVQAVKPNGDVNAGDIYLGGSNTDSTNGLVLSPGTFFTFPPQETNAYCVEDIYIDAANAGDGVKFIYSTR